MSTQGNDPKKAAEASSAGGVNAWKVNRTGLASPSPEPPRRADKPEPASASKVPQAPYTASARQPNKRALAVGLSAGLVAIAAVTCVWFSTRPAPSPRAGVSRSGAEFGAGSAPRGATNGQAALPVYRALVIGINTYRPAGGEGWQALGSARADAESIAGTLAADYGFHVQTLLDGEATRAVILNAMDALATSDEDGADLIYFAGHGCYDEKLQEGYWIPADARKTVDGRPAKEDWLWNSTLTRLINASRARHVLVLADSCYGGSLFRGDEPLSARNNQAWYERAIAKPSRYLITSGGIEPVLDSGAGHSVFAQQILNFLEHGDRNVFSANDLGSSLRERVAALTGQMVQMGPLPVSGHAGGEFVFVRQKAGVHLASFSPASAEAAVGTATRGDATTNAPARQEALRDAVTLTRAGAPKAANRLVSEVLQLNAQDQLARSVADYIARSQRQEGRDELRTLIEKIEAKGRESAAAAGGKRATGARPRVLACLGPTFAAGGPAAESEGLLYRIALRSELESHASLRIIEREALATLLQEQNLGVSDLADPRARTAIGKLLPASLLLLGDVIASETGDKVFLRLVDTETTQVLASFTATRKAGEDQEKVCAELAGRIAERVAVLKPLLAPVSELDGKRLRAGVGSFHGVRAGAVFAVLTRTLRDKKAADDYAEKEVGTATVSGVSEFSSDFDAVWSAEAPTRAEGLWLRERPVPASKP